MNSVCIGACGHEKGGGGGGGRSIDTASSIVTSVSVCKCSDVWMKCFV